MSRALIERRLVEVTGRLKRLREELSVAAEQLARLDDDADDARLRALVSETPLADRDHRDADRHEAMRRHHAAVVAEIHELERSQDELLDRLTAGVGMSGGPRLVIAEDEAIIRLDLVEMLTDEGYDVVADTGDGDEAIRLVRAHRPDLVLVDIKMPGRSGLDVAREVHDEGLCGVLVLTAFSQRELVAEATASGALAYLVKPFERSELVAAVEVALARHVEIANLVGEARELTERLETRKIVDRAKGILMDEHGMREAEAFSFMQKTAMAQRRTMRVVAADILVGDLRP